MHLNRDIKSCTDLGKMFKKHDTDSNGYLEPDEILALLKDTNKEFKIDNLRINFKDLSKY